MLLERIFILVFSGSVTVPNGPQVSVFDKLDCALACLGNRHSSFSYNPDTKSCLPSFTTSLGVSNISTSQRDQHYIMLEAKSCLDHPGYAYDTGLCTTYITSAMTWPEARGACMADGGSLVKLDSEEKNSSVKSFLRKSKDYIWVGGNDIAEEGRWVWTDETLVSGFLDWDKSVTDEPDGGKIQNCMSVSSEGWFSGGCSDTKHSFLCEVHV